MLTCSAFLPAARGPGAIVRGPVSAPHPPHEATAATASTFTLPASPKAAQCRWQLALLPALVALLQACGEASPPAAVEDTAASQAPRPARQAMAAATPMSSQPAAEPVAPDELFDWAERQYPSLFPGRSPTLRAAPYVYRFYPATGVYLGVAHGSVYGLGGPFGRTVQLVGPMDTFACEVRGPACEAPSWSERPADTRVQAGLPAFFAAEVAGGPGLRYQWLRNGEPVPGATTPRWMWRAPQTSDDGAQLQLRVENARGMLLSPAVTLRVDPPPDMAAALELARQAGCMQCHTISVMASGPAFTDIAGRYSLQPTAVEDLMLSVRIGSAGVWNGFMPPHPGLTEAELRLLASAILALAPP